jgi:hypothetical protein
MPTGVNSLQQFVLPQYWDAGELKKYELADGSTYEQLVADIAGALAIANADLLADPLISSLISPTTDLGLEYGTGVSNGFQVHTEFGRPDAKRGAVTGHMLPLVGYDRMLGWTWDFLRKARRSQIDNDIASAIRDLKDIFQKRVLTRLFKETYDAVGSSGRSMPLADGGTADANYIPLPVPERAAAFASTHDHIGALNGITQANLEIAVKNLWEHGHDAPYDLLVSQADIASWTNTANVTGFVPRSDPLIRYGATADLANVDASYLGVVDTKYGACRLRVSGRIPTKWWSVFKSYGALDQRNPLVVRFGTDYGAGATLLRGDSIRQYPLEQAMLFFEFGVGVRDRVGAVAAYNDAGAYSDPVIV